MEGGGLQDRKEEVAGAGQGSAGEREGSFVV